MKDYGILQVYTGCGKGKTSAARGVAFRACARGARVLMLAFLKDDPNYSALKKEPLLTKIQG